MNFLITGSFGLVGLTTSLHFLKKGNVVYGIDNSMRQQLFGSEGKTDVNARFLLGKKNYHHYRLDIRKRESIFSLFKSQNFDVIIHTAAQPSHEKSREIPLVDFNINTVGTLNLLEATRKYSNKAVFIFTCSNKVYGDNPNKMELVEKNSRFDFADQNFMGFDESTSVDNCLHSLFGASKLAADIYVQEYGKNYGLKTTVLRLGCVTGSYHSGLKLHGFLSFLIKSLVQKKRYEVIGYRGKQVRDQIHALDLTSAFEAIIKAPSVGLVYNLGGGRGNSASVLELIEILSEELKIKPQINYVSKARLGDHICYITDNTKFKKNILNGKLRKI